MNEAPARQMVLDVLYVEDHPVNVLVMQALFERRPRLRLAVASDGRRALEMATSIRPSLLLIDLWLPDCNGSELLGLLRHRAGWHDVPAVAVTAATGVELADTGFCEIWEKPLNLDSVLHRLDELLEPERFGPVRAPGASPPVPPLGSRP